MPPQSASGSFGRTSPRRELGVGTPRLLVRADFCLCKALRIACDVLPQVRELFDRLDETREAVQSAELSPKILPFGAEPHREAFARWSRAPTSGGRRASARFRGRGRGQISKRGGFFETTWVLHQS